MSGSAELSDDGRTMAVRVPMTVARQGGRKVVVAPDEAVTPRSSGKVDSALVKALARAFRWRKLIETGVHGTIADLAGAEKINPSYVSRMLRLTLLSPAIVEEILDGRPPSNITLPTLAGPLLWDRPPRDDWRPSR